MSLSYGSLLGLPTCLNAGRVARAPRHERPGVLSEAPAALRTERGELDCLEQWNRDGNLVPPRRLFRELQRHDKPVIIANVAGFWRPLLALLDHMRQQGFIRPQLEARYLVCDTVDQILPQIEAAWGKTRAPQRELRPEL